MPFVKREGAILSAAAPPPADELATHIAALASPDAEARWQGARALAGRAEAVAPLAVALGVEAIPRVREAIMTALMRIGNAASVEALLPYLRSQDAGQRAAAIEALQGLPQEISPFLTALLADGDSDVRILATELARNFPAAEATRLLCGLLTVEPHPNVCAAAIDVLAEVGTEDAIPVLEQCGRRFASTPFLPFAAAKAITLISGEG
jgi:HEAT repeat protein